MTHALLLTPSSRRSKWLPLRKTRRAGMAQPLRAQARMLAPRVYCDPRMPEGWTEVTD